VESDTGDPDDGHWRCSGCVWDGGEIP
jgi:hypothetical protein